MAWYVASALGFWTLCLFLSWIAKKDHWFVDRPGFVWICGVALILGFGVIVAGASVVSRAIPAYGALFLLMAFVPGLLLLFPWIWHAIGVFTTAAQRAAAGIDTMTVRHTYDAAEKLMHERRYGDAEREFLAGAEAVTDDPEPLLQAGEAARAGGSPVRAVGHFRRALDRTESEEDRASLGVRIAEIEKRELADPAAALRTLEGLLSTMAPGKWADCVKEALQRSRES